MKSFRGSIESDVLGKSEFCHTINFECDLVDSGPDGDVTCWGPEYEQYRFAELPPEDRQKIIKSCIEEYQSRAEGLEEWLNERLA